MAFTPETGAGVTGANSLVTTATVDAYWADRGVDSGTGASWDALTAAEKQQKCVLATDYVVRRYRFGGTKKTYAQGTVFPRTGLTERDGQEVPDDVVPWQVQHAVSFLAGLAAAGTDLSPVLDRGNRIKSEGVAGITTTYMDDAPSESVLTYVDGLLFPLLSDSGVMDTSAAGRLKHVDPSSPSYVAPTTPDPFVSGTFDN